MKSSSIGLVKTIDNKDYLVNLIDSPGHVEFSSEVSTALRLTDGALVLVDVIEGVSPQTITVLKQCYQEKVKCILVINKIDRLILHQQISPMEGYQVISQIIEQVNAILSSFVNQEKHMKEQEQKKKNSEQNENNEVDLEQYIEEMENKFYFAPENGNLLFCSALDGWGFTTNYFAGLFHKKLGLKLEVLEKYIYGEFYYNNTTKKITRKPPSSKSEPMFVNLILNNIWKVYETIMGQDKEQIIKIAKGIKVDLPNKILDQVEQISPVSQYLMSNWLNLGQVALDVIVKYLPSPVQAQKDRLEVICKPLINFEEIQKQRIFLKKRKNSKNDEDTRLEIELEEEKNKQYTKLRDNIQQCNYGEEAPIVLFISKMLQIPSMNINERQMISHQEIARQGPNRLIAFCRIFSGVIKRGSELYVIHPNSTVQDEESLKMDKKLEIQKVKIQYLYRIMAQNLDAVQEVKAGNVFAIGGLQDDVFKTATLSSFIECPSFTPLYLGAENILRVKISVTSYQQEGMLIEGLKRLNKADPSVSIQRKENGDIVLGTCGQVHLERCITDLGYMMGQMEIKTSEPIVSYKETITYNSIRQIHNLKKKNKEEINKINYEEIEEEDELELIKQWKVENLINLEDVELVNTEQIKEQDTRYNLLDEDKEKEKYKYAVEKEKDPKNKDYYNKGKSMSLMSKVNILDIPTKPNLIKLTTPNQLIILTIRAIGFNFELAEWLERQRRKMKRLFKDDIQNYDKQDVKSFLKQFIEQLNVFIKDKKLRELILSNLLCFGPNKFGPNMLIVKQINKEDSLVYKLQKKIEEFELFEKIEKNKIDLNENLEDIEQEEEEESKENFQHQDPFKLENMSYDEVISTIQWGYDLAVKNGPMCLEEMMGVCFVIENVEINKEQQKETDQKQYKDPYGPLQGQMMSTVKAACLESFLGAKPRLVEGMFECNLQCDIETYPKVFKVLNSRRSKVLGEELSENSNLYLIKAHLPLAESFDFYTEMQIQTSGRVNAQLVFDTWKIRDEDPFFIPKTIDEKEEHGDNFLYQNNTKSVIDKIRKRKGIFTEEKIVIAAEKQSNISKKA